MQRRSLLLAALGWLLQTRGFAQAASPAGKTQAIADLKSALLETRTQALWLAAAARQADQDGFARLGVLFRAAAHSETVQGDNFAKALRLLGDTSDPPSGSPPAITNSNANLKTLLAELPRRAERHATAARTARANMQVPAIKPFNWARANLLDLQTLVKAAADNLPAWKTATPFFVCGVCGHLVAKIDFKKCVVCFFSRDEYKQIN